MLVPTFGVVLSLAAAVSGFALEARVCGDNCARGLQHTTRPGAADCSSFLHTTVTPPTVTSTTTLTVSTEHVSVQGVTETQVVHDTATETRHLTATLTTTLPVIFKRQATAIPTYASACSGVVRYSSACSCLGVFASTSTAPAPSVTVTVQETTTYTTEVLTSTVATTTVTEIESTLTQTVTDATQTVEVKPERQFVIQIAHHADQSLIGQYFRSDGNRFFYTPSLAVAQKFQINYNNGYLYDGANKYVAAPPNSFNLLGWAELSWIYAPLTCSRDSDNILSCTSRDGFSIFANYYGQVAWARNQGELNSVGITRLTLRAVFL